MSQRDIEMLKSIGKDDFLNQVHANLQKMQEELKDAQEGRMSLEELKKATDRANLYHKAISQMVNDPPENNSQ